MSFGFVAQGSREEVLSSLEGLTLTDDLGMDLRDNLVSYISSGADPGPDQRYVISASGHSGMRSLVSLNVSVTVEPIPAATAADPVPGEDGTPGGNGP
jgi:hypothetical protein